MSEVPQSIEERLYGLLPAVHRIRDAAQGQPLRALLAILERELAAVQEDTRGLYDSWFIETCPEWVVPYLGDALGVQLVRSIAAEGFSQRAFVANTLGYRRRKGTAGVLEQLARDVTGWPARVVEYFERLATTQHLGHVRLHAPATASLRSAERLEFADGPFGTECHTLDVRSIELGRGRFNIPNIGLHVWRLRPYPLQRVDARVITTTRADLDCYTFDPLGWSGPLFNDPRAETDIVHLAEERDVPARLRRRALHAELQRLLEPDGAIPKDGWFGVQPVLQVRVDGAGELPLAPAELCICDLDLDATAPPARTDSDRSGADSPPAPLPAPRAYVDPELGRLALKPSGAAAPGPPVLVDYVYAFSADIGGGPYDRRSTVPERLTSTSEGTFQHGVSKDEARRPDEPIHEKLALAIDAWNRDALVAAAANRSLDRVIAIMDSRTYVEPLIRGEGHCIVVPPGCRLRLFAARWPFELNAMTGGEQRNQGRLDPSGVRPHLRGDIEVLPIGDPVLLGGGTLEIDGLLVEGHVTVLPGTLGTLALRHSTLVPGKGGLRVAPNPGLELELTQSILDGVSVAGSVRALHMSDCIVDKGAAAIAPVFSQVGWMSEAKLGEHLARLAEEPRQAAAILAVLGAVPDLVIEWNSTPAGGAIAAAEVDAEIERSTLLGPIAVRQLEGSESLFTEHVAVRVVQEGCLRYSYAPPSSLTPKRFRCQPDLASQAAVTAAEDAGEAVAGADLATTRALVRPLFTSTTYGHPAYCQLARAVGHELSRGAEDGSEMGVFSSLKQAHRESNLESALEQYLRFGLDAGLIFVT
jgi:hypothetical protein